MFDSHELMAEDEGAFVGDGNAAMMDQGFKKFRRRGNRVSGAAPSSVASVPAERAVLDQETPTAGGRIARPVKAPVAAEPRPVEPSARPAQAPSGQPAEPEPEPRFARTATALRRQAKLDVDVESDGMVPARLPDPWTLFHPVSISGLDPRHRRLPLVDAFRASPTARAFDLLRTRMLHTLQERGWKRVAICAPTQGCGASFTAVNLALSLARVPRLRTVLMDLNLRRPAIASALGIERTAMYHGDMAGFLRGETRLEDHLVAASDGLALGLGNSQLTNSSELLHEGQCRGVLDEMMRRTQADVALFDLPPMLESDDLAAFLPQVDAVLLVSGGKTTTAKQLKACERQMSGRSELLGVVLNQARGHDI
nr:exopolysaccharide biosynthesis protein [Phaeobacter sp. HF9A]